MTEYVAVRASEILDQGELVSFLNTRFPASTKPVGKPMLIGMATVETRVLAHSREFDVINEFIASRRRQGQRAYSGFAIGRMLRKYTRHDLQNAEALLLRIQAHLEPSGEECGTVYETLCSHCNWGRQVSDLSLDLRRVPQHKDIAETIAWVEWVVSSGFVQAVTEHRLTGADFRPIFDLRNPLTASVEWRQFRVIGDAGGLAAETKIGKDPFSPTKSSWRCPSGHSLVGTFLSEVYLNRGNWDGSDFAVTKVLFGQGRNLLRPKPLIIISQKAYCALESAGIKGISYERVHFV